MGCSLLTSVRVDALFAQQLHVLSSLTRVETVQVEVVQLVRHDTLLFSALFKGRIRPLAAKERSPISSTERAQLSASAVANSETDRPNSRREHNASMHIAQVNGIDRYVCIATPRADGEKLRTKPVLTKQTLNILAFIGFTVKDIRGKHFYSPVVLVQSTRKCIQIPVLRTRSLEQL